MYCFGLWNKCLVLSFNCFTCWLIWVWKIWVFNSFKVLPHSTFDCKQLIENCLKLNWNERSWSLNLTFYDILVSSRYYYYPKVGMYTIQGGKKKKKKIPILSWHLFKSKSHMVFRRGIVFHNPCIRVKFIFIMLKALFLFIQNLEVECLDFELY